MNAVTSEPPLIKAGLGHLWFVTLHPFEDGNGRVALAVRDCLLAHAVDSAQQTLDGVLSKARFWQRVAGIALNARQSKLLNQLLDGFEGKLTSRKWADIAGCSPDTALRDINELIELGILRRAPEGGRSTAYELVTDGE